MEPQIQSRSPLRVRIREAQRRAILQAAEEVFSEDGLQSGRMELVARRAEVSVGTLYNYFADRESLLRILLETRREELLESVDRALAEGPATFRGQLRSFLDSAFAHFQTHRTFLSLFLQEETESLKVKLAPPRGQRTFDRLQERAELITKRGVDEGLLRKQGAHLWSHLLVGSLHAVLVQEMTHPPGDTNRRDPGEQVFDFFLAGAGSAPKSAKP
jgi:AcrR family transcriptional regulator